MGRFFSYTAYLVINHSAGISSWRPLEEGPHTAAPSGAQNRIEKAVFCQGFLLFSRARQGRLLHSTVHLAAVQGYCLYQEHSTRNTQKNGKPLIPLYKDSTGKLQPLAIWQCTHTTDLMRIIDREPVNVNLVRNLINSHVSAWVVNLFSKNASLVVLRSLWLGSGKNDGYFQLLWRLLKLQLSLHLEPNNV